MNVFCFKSCFYRQDVLDDGAGRAFSLSVGLMFIVYYEPVYKNTKKAVKGWGILGMLCGGIHLYFLPMCGVILLGFVLLDAVKGRKKWKALLPLGSYLAAAAGTVFLFGGFASGMKAGNDGRRGPVVSCFFII